MKNTDFDLVVLGVTEWDLLDDNLDVEIKFPNGYRYTATFFTVENIRSLFTKNKSTGECLGGKYLWATEMILVEKLDRETMIETVTGLLKDGEFELAFTKVSDTPQIS